MSAVCGLVGKADPDQIDDPIWIKLNLIRINSAHWSDRQAILRIISSNQTNRFMICRSDKKGIQSMVILLWILTVRSHSMAKNVDLFFAKV